MLVMTAEGTPATNADISLSVLPRGGIPAGTPDHVIARAVTGTDGTFSIPAPTLDTWSLQQATMNGGWLNMQVDANDAVPDTSHLGASSMGTAMEHASTGLAVLVSPGSLVEAKVGTIRMMVNPVTLVADQAPGQTLATLGDEKTAVVRLVSNLTYCVETHLSCFIKQSPASQCNPYGDWYNISGNGEVDWDPVGEYHTVDDMTGRFDYGQYASSNLGVGFNYSNGAGWQTGGSVYIGNSNNSSRSSGYNEGPWFAKEIDGQFHYIEEEADPSGCATEPGPEYRIRADFWTTGLSDYVSNSTAGDGQSSYCSVPSNRGYQADYNPGGWYDSVNGSGQTYIWDVSAFGVTLSSETDYSQQEHLHWDFGTVSDTQEWHSVFSFYAPLSSPNYKIINASTEPYGQKC